MVKMFVWFVTCSLQSGFNTASLYGRKVSIPVSVWTFTGEISDYLFVIPNFSYHLEFGGMTADDFLE